MSPRSSTRMPELMSDDRALLDALLDSTAVGHISFVDADGQPAVMPTAVVRWGDRIVTHGSTGSRWMRIADGANVAVAITAIDGIIVARSAFESSIAYRSAVIYGAFTRLDGNEKLAALDAITERLLPGRLAEVRGSTAKELAATMVLALDLDDWTLRVSDGWPDDPDSDQEGPAWAGRIRFGARPAVAEAAPDLRAGIATPPSVRDFSEGY